MVTRVPCAAIRVSAVSLWVTLGFLRGTMGSQGLFMGPYGALFSPGVPVGLCGVLMGHLGIPKELYGVFGHEVAVETAEKASPAGSAKLKQGWVWGEPSDSLGADLKVTSGRMAPGTGL